MKDYIMHFVVLFAFVIGILIGAGAARSIPPPGLTAADMVGP